MLSIISFLLIVAVFIRYHFYYTKTRSKQIYLLPFHCTNNNLKLIDISNRTYCFFDDMINIKELDPNKIKINEKSYKNILIYYIGYVTFNEISCVKINSANPLYLIINKINGYFEEINGLNIWHWVLPKRQRQNKKVWRSMEQNQRYYYINN